jgi:hypothetical protein
MKTVREKSFIDIFFYFILIVSAITAVFMGGYIIGSHSFNNEEKEIVNNKQEKIVVNNFEPYYEKAKNKELVIITHLNFENLDSLKEPFSKMSDEGYFPEQIIKKDSEGIIVWAKRYPSLKEREEYEKHMKLLKKRMTKDENEASN